MYCIYYHYTADTQGLIITGLVPTASKLPHTRTNRNGYTSEVLLGESGAPASDEDEDDIDGEYGEGMDQLRVLPNQLLPGKAVRISGEYWTILMATLLYKGSSTVRIAKL